MMLMPRPRILPVTIAVIAGLLAVKSIHLAYDGVRFLAAAAVVSPARAAVEPPAAAAPPAPAAAPSPAAAAAPPPAAPALAAPALAAPALAAPLLAAPAQAVPAQAAPPPAAPAEPPAISDAERAVLLDLRQRRQALDAREQALQTQASVLAAAEQKLAARVSELQSLQQSLEKLEAARQQREDTGWRGLVKLYEAMKPRDAATIFDDLDMPVLLQLADRMKETKAAPILAAMHPDKARDVTAQLAAMRARREQPPGIASGG